MKKSAAIVIGIIIVGLGIWQMGKLIFTPDPPPGRGHNSPSSLKSNFANSGHISSSNHPPILRQAVTLTQRQLKPNQLINRQLVSKSNESATLGGQVSNRFGIRDDILAYILQAIPAANPAGRKAAIHYAQLDREISFNSDPDQARAAMPWLSNAGWCFSAFVGEREEIEIRRKIEELERNTQERAEHEFWVEEKILSGHIYPTKIGNLAYKSATEIKEFCLSGGNYLE